ncbi:Crp/Fnr family transcriptional regulator [Burkholderia stagnalis]|uniref:Crp/Fnr family transcriptional regulator n=1 Tax=Burkholderia stagnalis TaxID=1503054 RepID=UPI000F5BBE3D|nr:Crp/Fnr family transcriptional regulator [Burkholderia stagnalis]RQQ01077.1 Crp/Fnr family transcriptional regulator [Burkholderia stagnalis]RQY68704.1 Crp/Fnr family transcriptional regulator [Burkholderia stagnalis]TCW78709.1 Crp/Fnr family transcriptional regulator [Burkholderia sp. SRS-46]
MNFPSIDPFLAGRRNSASMDAPDPFAAAAAAIDTHGTGVAKTSLPERVWPDDIPSPAPANAPRILRELKARLSRYLDKPAQWLAQLNAANGSRRQQRSERRLACVQLARAMIKYCDLRTMRIGVPGAAGWIDFTLPYLASQAGLSERRAERALRDLQKARLVKVRRQCELEETEQGVRYKGVASIKYLTSTLFEAFGLGKWLRHERTRAHLRAQRRANQQRKRTQQGAALGAQLVEQIAGIEARARRQAAAADAAQCDAADLERAIKLRVGELLHAHPDWDRDSLYAAARRQIAPPGDSA